MKYFILGIIIISGSWIWFIEFGGWDFLLETSRRYSQFHRMANLLDHPNIYYKWQSSMKVFDPLYPWYWYRPNNLKIFNLDIADTDFQAINSSRELACDKRIYIPGKLTLEGMEYALKISYHGYTFNHWSDRKKSWVIEFDNGEELNLIAPVGRSYFSESLNNYRAKKLGLLSQNDDWIWLKINGKDSGVYYTTGGWNKYWLNKSGKPISQLVGEWGCQIDGKFAEVWGGVENWKYYIQAEDEKYSNYLKKFLDTVNNYSGEDFFDEIDKIMDLNTLIRWKSVSILMNSFHTDNVHNWRMWLNPKTFKFEILPMGKRMTFPAKHLTDFPFILDGSIDQLSYKIYSSAKLSLSIDQTLWEYVRDDRQLEDDLLYWDDLKNRLSPYMYADRNKHFGNISLRTIPLVRSEIIGQYKDIRDYLTLEDVRIKIEKSDNETYLIISSHQPTQVELESIIVNDQQFKISDRLLFSPQIMTLIDGQYVFDRIFAELRIPINCTEICWAQVTAKNLVTGAIRSNSIEYPSR